MMMMMMLRGVKTPATTASIAVSFVSPSKSSLTLNPPAPSSPFTTISNEQEQYEDMEENITEEMVLHYTVMCMQTFPTPDSTTSERGKNGNQEDLQCQEIS
eukprot:12226925-Ditylum_brightwellii.AAC.1